MRLLVELVFEIHVLSMELQRFEKPYGTLLNSSNWATGGPIFVCHKKTLSFFFCWLCVQKNSRSVFS